MYKAVIFDFFDVIHRDHQKAWLRRYGFERTGAFAEASSQLDLGRIDYDEYLHKLAAASGQHVKEICRQFEEFAALDEDAVELVRELHGSGIRTGLLSNSNSGELRPILERHALEQLFDEIIISGEAKLAKPDTAVFQLILNRLDVAAQEVLFTDDNHDNIKAASSLGMRVVCFETTTALRAELTALGMLGACVTA